MEWEKVIIETTIISLGIAFIFVGISYLIDDRIETALYEKKEKKRKFREMDDKIRNIVYEIWEEKEDDKAPAEEVIPSAKEPL
jgi:hypothetical protein